jgi:tetratricopeptide (TPR) repeat protein
MRPEIHEVARRLDPKYMSAYNNRGSVYFTKGDYDRAIKDFDEAIRLDPKDAGAYNNRGSAYKRVYDAAPDTSPPPADETVIAGRVRTKMIRQIAPRCPGSQDPEDAVEDTSVVYPRNATRLIRQHGLDGNPFVICEFVAHDSSPQFGSLNHEGLANANSWRGPGFGAYSIREAVPLCIRANRKNSFKHRLLTLAPAVSLARRAA